MRIQERSSGKLTSQTNISYQKIPDNSWEIESWESTRFTASNSIKSVVKGAVTELKTNPLLPTDYFSFHFPANTLLYDQRDKKSYNVKSDGSMVELDSKGNELSTAKYDPGYTWQYRNRWLLTGVLAIAIVAGFLYLKMKRKLR